MAGRARLRISAWVCPKSASDAFRCPARTPAAACAAAGCAMAADHPLTRSGVRPAHRARSIAAADCNRGRARAAVSPRVPVRDRPFPDPDVKAALRWPSSVMCARAERCLRHSSSCWLALQAAIDGAGSPGGPRSRTGPVRRTGRLSRISAGSGGQQPPAGARARSAGPLRPFARSGRRSAGRWRVPRRSPKLADRAAIDVACCHRFHPALVGERQAGRGAWHRPISQLGRDGVAHHATRVAIGPTDQYVLRRTTVLSAWSGDSCVSMKRVPC